MYSFTLRRNTLSDEKKNPYVEMTADVLQTHLQQLSTTVKEKKIDVSQFFGAAITEDQENKLKSYDSMVSQVEKLSTDAAGKDLSEVEKRLTQTNIDSIVSDIKKFDDKVPLTGILSGNLDNITKIDVLNNVKDITKHYNTVVDNLKKELPQKSKDQTFGEGVPGDTDDAEKIVNNLLKTYAGDKDGSS